MKCSKNINLFLKLNDTLKQANSISQIEVDKIAVFLLNELNKTSSKDVIRKLFIRSLNTLSQSNLISLAEIKSAFVNFIQNNSWSIGHKLFILNIYLENLNQFGLDCIAEAKMETLEFLSTICVQQINELKISTAPIVISKLVQNLQLLFKTFIIYLQKCYHLILNEKDQLSTIYNSILELKELKSIFNLELGYAACMVQVLLNSYESDSIRILIEKSIKSDILIEDLCFFQAVLTMVKAEQILEENLVNLFEKILVHTLEASNDLIDVGYSIAVSRTVNFWLLKLMEMANVECSSMEYIFRSDSHWFKKLLNFIWSHFDHNIDVIKNTAMNNYRIILQVVKIVKKGKFYNFRILIY